MINKNTQSKIVTLKKTKAKPEMIIFINPKNDKKMTTGHSVKYAGHGIILSYVFGLKSEIKKELKIKIEIIQ